MKAAEINHLISSEFERVLRAFKPTTEYQAGIQCALIATAHRIITHMYFKIGDLSLQVSADDQEHILRDAAKYADYILGFCSGFEELDKLQYRALADTRIVKGKILR